MAIMMAMIWLHRKLKRFIVRLVKCGPRAFDGCDAPRPRRRLAAARSVCEWPKKFTGLRVTNRGL